MDTPEQTDWTTPTPADARLEAALRAESAALRDSPAPHMVPRVLDTIRSLRANTPAAPGPARRSSRLRRVSGHALTWLGVAAAALVVSALWVAPPETDVSLGHGALPTALRVPPLHDMAPWLGPDEAPLLSRQLEQPLLDEADGWKLDAERAAAAIIQPLMRSLIQLQLRPSVQGTGGSLGR